MKKPIEAGEILQHLEYLTPLRTVGAEPKDHGYRRYIKHTMKTLQYIRYNAEQTGRPFFEEWVSRREGDPPSLILSTHDTYNPDIAMMIHTDVTPGEKREFTLRLDGDDVYGKGTADMRFGIAGALASMSRIRYEMTGPSVAFAFTPDEETGGQYGAGYLAKVGWNPSVIFVPDGGDNWTVVEHAKGGLHVVFQAKGEKAHGSRPHLGKDVIPSIANAIVTLGERWDTLSTHERAIDEPTLVFGSVHAGDAANSVADKGKLLMDFRFLQPEHRIEFLDSLQAAILPGSKLKDPNPLDFRAKTPRGVRVRGRVTADITPFTTDVAHPDVELYRQIIKDQLGVPVLTINETGATDARHFPRSRVIVSSPPGGLTRHSIREKISLQGAVDYATAFTRYTHEYPVDSSQPRPEFGSGTRLIPVDGPFPHA